MSHGAHQTINVYRLLKEQVVINFVVVALIIAAGGYLVFKVDGEQYTQFTSLAFVATCFFSFVAFLPAGTLFASRAEFAKGRVAVAADERTGATASISDPWSKTVPLGLALAAVSTAVFGALIYGFGWTPSPLVTTLVSFLFVVPYAYIVRSNIFRDIEGLAAIGAMRGQRVTSTSAHVWMSYIIPNVVFQAIINMPLANRGFSHAMSLIADKAPGMVPVQALVPDFAITFMFVCCFTFLGVAAHAVSDMYQGTFTYPGKKHAINGLLYFGILLLMGVGLGVVVAGVATVMQVAIVTLPVALLLKFLVVFLSVYVACRLGVGWTGKKFNEAMSRQEHDVPPAVVPAAS
ncbi:MAG TPA: hypothetical protein VKI44_39660 [Acetobacteraceae bacterium]|nr:hypothetical protein [Acetobacteraceae bacterium]